MIKEYWFKVKYGFGALDQISITDLELEKALYAQKFGVTVQLGDRQINGKYIISIEPHWHKYTGWFEGYNPSTGDDFRQIKRDCPEEIENVIREKRQRIDYLISHNQVKLIGQNVPIPELEAKKVERLETPTDTKI